MVAESKTVDEASFAEVYLKDEIRAHVLAEKLLAWHMRWGSEWATACAPNYRVQDCCDPEDWQGVGACSR